MRLKSFLACKSFVTSEAMNRKGVTSIKMFSICGLEGLMHKSSHDGENGLTSTGAQSSTQVLHRTAPLGIFEGFA